MKKFAFGSLLLIGLFALQQRAQTQDGAPFMTSFSTDETMNENYSMCLDKDGVLVLANRKGILTFDATEWKVIQTPDLPLTVAMDTNSGVIFAGLRNNIGCLEKDNMGVYSYKQLAGKEAGTVVHIEFLNDYAYFLSQSVVTRIDIKNPKDIHFWKSKAQKPFISMFQLNKKMYVDAASEGLLEIQENDLKPAVSRFLLNGKITFAVAFDQKNEILGASDNKLYLFDGTNIKPYILQDQQYISDGNISEGKELGADWVVVSTVNAGCLVFDKKSGKTIFTVNLQSGLPDDEIMALATDKNKGIWLAHYYGLTRVDAGIPVKNYSYFKGLEGKPQCSDYVDDKLYIGTSNGVYFLDKKKDFVEYTVKPVAAAPIQQQQPKVTENVQVAPATVQAVPEKEQKKGFFSRMFAKKKKDADEVKQPSANDNKSAEEKTNSSIWNLFGSKDVSKDKAVKEQKVYKLASVSHVYAKIPGLDFKCKQFINFGTKLLALTTSGIYEITNTKALPVVVDGNINNVFAATDQKVLFVCTDKGITTLKQNGGKWETKPFVFSLNEPAYSIAVDMYDNYWIGAENKAIRVKLKRDGTLKESRVFQFGSQLREMVIVRIANKKPVFFLSSGIYSIFNDSVQANLKLSKYVGTNTKYYFNQQDLTWVRNGNEWLSLSASAEPDTTAPNYLGLFENVSQIYADKSSNLWIIDNNAALYKIDQKGIAAYSSEFSAFIKRFAGTSGVAFALDGVELDQNNNYLTIIISAPYYIKPNSNQYQILVEGIMKDWGKWTSSPEFPISLTSGNWKIKVRAKNIFGKISEEQTLNFYIKKPFYQTLWFVLICFAIAVYGVYLFIKYRERQLQHEKDILEEKVKERTRQIEEQKEEILTQRDSLEIQNAKITIQKEELVEQSNKIALQNQEITDSIRYAKRLQTAVMPDNDIISSMLSDYFVLFRPKDIVSGDFYWAKNIRNKAVIAAADCTGHGVPGGFLSMLGVSFLNEISAIEREFKANEILNLLRARVKGTLIKEGHGEDQSKDGMDISLCIIDKENHKVQYAGANNSIYLIRNGELIEYDADKMPIGAYLVEKESFTNNEIDILPGDEIFMFSDGYRDQLGGPNEKRLKSGGFRKILLEICDKPMRKQKEILEAHHDEWRGVHEQVDDIMVLGIKF